MFDWPAPRSSRSAASGRVAPGHGAEFEATALRERRNAPLNVVLPVPLSGSAGLWGPSCLNGAELAAAEINERGGIHGRRVNLIPLDAGREPAEVAEDIRDLLVSDGKVDAVVGMHLSNTRTAIASVLEARIPYVFTTIYEGRQTDRSTTFLGETSSQMLRPSMRWLAQERAVRNWFFVGNDYVWPRVSCRHARQCIRDNGGVLAGELFVPLGSEDFSAVLQGITSCDVDAVLMFLVGGDLIAFNRAFAESGMASRMLRFTVAADENILYGIGAENVENLYCCSGYLASLRTRENDRLIERYMDRFGAQAPAPNTFGVSCYEGLKYLEAAARLCGSLHARELAKSTLRMSYDGARGPVLIRDGRVSTPLYLTRAEGLEFRVLKTFR